MSDRQYARLYDTITPVNTFRIVLSQYLGFDIPLLPDRAFDVGGPETKDVQSTASEPNHELP